jgi:hypothetical protein
MAHGIEFDSSDYEFDFGISVSAPTSEMGKSSIPNGVIVHTPNCGSAFLPASGNRETDGTISTYRMVGSWGLYWSGSVWRFESWGSDGHLIMFQDGVVNKGTAGSSTYGFSVRCVKN